MTSKIKNIVCYTCAPKNLKLEEQSIGLLQEKYLCNICRQEKNAIEVRSLDNSVFKAFCFLLEKLEEDAFKREEENKKWDTIGKTSYMK